MLANSASCLGLNLIKDLHAWFCWLPTQSCSPEPRVRLGALKGSWQKSPCWVLPDILIWVSPRPILALLLSSSTRWLIKVAVARLSRQLGSLPRPSLCPVIAGVTHVWLGLEVGPCNRNCFFLKPQAWDLAGRPNSVFPLSALGSLSQTGIEWGVIILYL